MKKWDILNKLETRNSKLETPDVIGILLENRKLTSQEDIDTFLNPRLEDVTIESVGIDKKHLQKTLTRIKEAVDKKEQIVIYGDYDVDGLTASAILWETLYHTLKANVTPYIPHRVDEGYGLSSKGITNLKSQKPNTKLIITVDNGIVAHEAVDFANEQGIDVIITDHHTVGPALPDAFAIIHTTKLCGAGIAYLLSQEIKENCHPELVSGSCERAPQSGMSPRLQMLKRVQPHRDLRHDGFEADDLLELAALGTIADLVPLQGANRTIVKHGLKKLSRTKRMGLLELFKEAGCNGNIGVYEVGHVIAPRLNATGRMASAMDSLRLLCTKDRSRAEQLAGLLGSVNKERQQVMADAAKHAVAKIKDQKSKIKNLLVAVHNEYPEGVIGLVAGRLVEEFYRPSIVIAKGEKFSKGSVRSISGFNIIEFLRQSSDFFVNVGGHPMAAGFTIETEKIEKMQEALEKLAESMDDGILVRTLRIDCELPLSLVTDKLFASLQPLAPFGMANPEPVFATRDLQIMDLRVLGRDGKHLRLTVSGPNAEMEAIAFGFGEKAAEMKVGDAIDLAYTIDMNEWNGRRKLQLKVKDIKTSNK